MPIGNERGAVDLIADFYAELSNGLVTDKPDYRRDHYRP